jgi:hypothetical protein
MKRETFIVVNFLSNSINALNALFCEYENETDITEETKEEMAEEIAKYVSPMAIEDLEEILAKVKQKKNL